jgi:hypothetical protein
VILHDSLLLTFFNSRYKPTVAELTTALVVQPELTRWPLIKLNATATFRLRVGTA